MMKMSMQTAMPLLGSACGSGTILLVYFLTWNAGHLPNGVATPPISLLGCNSPEHEAYQIGFTLTGLLLLGNIQNWKAVFYPRLKDQNYRFVTFLTLVGSYMAVLGVIGQGVVTLEENMLANIKQGKDMAQQSSIHQILALVFFTGSAMHCYLTMYMCYCGNTPTYSKNSVRIKLACVLTSFVSWPIAEALHPTNASHLSKRGFAVGGLAQYITVISYILFFGSYSIDFSSRQQQQELQDDSNKKD
jgi:hypothetical protein